MQCHKAITVVVTLDVPNPWSKSDVRHRFNTWEALRFVWDLFIVIKEAFAVVFQDAQLFINKLRCTQHPH